MAKTKNPVEMDRRGGDRRESDRRQQDVVVENDRRVAPRRKVQRRRQIDPTTCERDYSDHEIEFMQALDAYKRANGRMFPTCSEILEVVRDLGYFRLNDEQIDVLREAGVPVAPTSTENAEGDEGGSEAETAEEL